MIHHQNNDPVIDNPVGQYHQYYPWWRQNEQIRANLGRLVGVITQNQFDLTLFRDLLGLTQGKSGSWPHSNDSIGA